MLSKNILADLKDNFYFIEGAADTDHIDKYLKNNPW